MNAEKYTQKSLQAIQNANNAAVERGNSELTALHLLYALLDRDGLVYRILARKGADAAGLARAAEEELDRLPRVSGAAAGNLYPTSALTRSLAEAEKLASSMKDDYVSVEHLFLCLFDNPERGTDKLFSRFGVNKNSFLTGLKEVRGNQNVTSDNPEDTYEALEKYGSDLPSGRANTSSNP